MRVTRPKIRGRGFTLVELIVTMTVMSILLLIAAWSFKDFIWRNKISTAANDFASALNLARSEAVTRGQEVTLCRSVNGTACAGSGTYRKGWVVRVDGTAEVLRSYPALADGIIIDRRDGNPVEDITYSSSGFLRNPDAGGTFWVFGLGRSIDVNLAPSGRVSTKVTPPL